MRNDPKLHERAAKHGYRLDFETGYIIMYSSSGSEDDDRSVFQTVAELLAVLQMMDDSEALSSKPVKTISDV